MGHLHRSLSSKNTSSNSMSRLKSQNPSKRHLWVTAEWNRQVLCCLRSQTTCTLGSQWWLKILLVAKQTIHLQRTKNRRPLSKIISFGITTKARRQMLTQYQPLISRGAVELILSSRVNSVKKIKFVNPCIRNLIFMKEWKVKLQ